MKRIELMLQYILRTRKTKKNKAHVAELFKLRHINEVDHKLIKGDDFVKSPLAFAGAGVFCVALHILSLQRKSINSSFLDIYTPYLWAFYNTIKFDVQVF